MISLVAATALLTSPVFETELNALIDPASVESVEVQDFCSFWTDPDDGDAQSLRAELASYATVCWEFPMSDLDQFGVAMDSQLTEARWAISESMGYSMVYIPVDPAPCLRQMVVSLMTKDAPADEETRVSAETAVILFMTPRADLELCE